MRKPVKWGLSLIPVSLGLFFGLFFGVAYPEIVSFDVSFTPWKWALVAIFGILPLFANLVFFAVLYGLLPLKDRAIEALRQRRLRNQLRAVPQYDQNEGNSRIAILRDDDGKAYALEDRSAVAEAFQAQAGSSQTRLYDDSSAPPEYSEVVSKEQKYADSGL
ncbi:hypothetical protein ONZ45_g6019 [Pleurotus djamor]|nr:hypothetical protein ONZ45_g6019 [Pleurotus djamor]